MEKMEKKTGKPLHRLQQTNIRNKQGKELLVNEVIDTEKQKIK